MLLFALAVVLFAYVAAGLGLRGKLPSGLTLYLFVFALFMIGAHVAVRRLAPYADPLLLPLDEPLPPDDPPLPRDEPASSPVEACCEEQAPPAAAAMAIQPAAEALNGYPPEPRLKKTG